MSINFNKKKVLYFSNKAEKLLLMTDLQKDTFKNNISSIVKTFDWHFLDFISLRKQRDLLITKEFLCYLLFNAEIKKDRLKQKMLSEFFQLKNSTIVINDDFLQISTKELNKTIEMKMKILKTIHSNLSITAKLISSSAIDDISAKIKKVILLDDDLFFKRLTNDKHIIADILAKIGKIKKYSEL